MPWFYLYDSTSGELLSELSERPPRLRAGTALLELAARASEAEMWDAAARAFVPRPGKVIRNHIDEFLQRPEMLILNAAQRDSVRQDLLARFRDHQLYH